jgi:uncharacterized RDD family membrane protein YckC
MDFYLTQNGVRRGPFRVFQIKEMLDRGEAAATDLGWHSGLTGWLPLSEIDAITPYLPRTTPPPLPAGEGVAGEAATDDKPDFEARRQPPDEPNGPRPPVVAGKWQLFGQRALPRFLARCFDSMLWFSLVCGAGVATGLLSPAAFTFPTLFGFWFVPLQALAWVFVEAWLLSRVGTTPGKWLFNLHVRNLAGERPAYLNALKRAFFIWVFAWGLGHPQWAMFGSLVSLMLFLQNGRMVWDYLVSTEVVHARPRTAAWFVFAVALGLYWAAKTLLMLTQPLPDSLPPAVRAQFQEQRAALREAYRASQTSDSPRPD